MLNAILSLFAFTGCTKDKEVQKDDVLSIPKTPYSGNQLKIDGYYYDLYNNKINTVRLFYRNGVVMDFSSIGDNIVEVEKNLKDSSLWEKIKGMKFMWGVFFIDGNQIKIEQWGTSSGGPLRAYVKSGTILNDTTYNINEIYRMQNGQKTEVRARSETFHFKAFSPKPDSTNKFIP